MDILRALRIAGIAHDLIHTGLDAVIGPEIEMKMEFDQWERESLARLLAQVIANPTTPVEGENFARDLLEKIERFERSNSQSERLNLPSPASKSKRSKQSSAADTTPGLER